MREAQERAAAQQTEPGAQTVTPAAPGEAPGVAVPGAAGGGRTLSRAEALADSPRIRIDNGAIHGSIALKGGRIDDVTLARYRETVDPTSPEIVLLSPPGAPHPYFAEYGWVPGDAGVPMPGPETVWAAQGGELTAKDGGHPELGQRPGAQLRQADRARPRLHVHDPAHRHQQLRQAGHPLPLRPDQPLGHAADAGLLHPARGPDRRAGRPAGGVEIQRRRRGGQGRVRRAPAAGSASPTNTGWPRWCRSRTCR